MGDVNGLKLINDTFGHQAGDRLLTRSADLLREHFRPKDVLCRWGGDEFIILLPQTEKQTALGICENILSSCRSDKEAIALSISLGAATKEKEHANIQSVMKEAEDRMYRTKLLESTNTRFTLVSSLQSLMDEKTEETIGHALRMQEHVLQLGKKIGLSSRDMDRLKLLSSLHDIGKIAIPDNIVMKLDTLTPEEWEIMKKHSEIGYRIALSAPELSHIAEELLHHHEWWDGSGYPSGLKADDIPLLSRIVAIADSYDVMTHGRPYKRALTREEAAKELKDCAGTHFDPHLIDVFLTTLE
jgi:diguanylate cyclase (GGDEF)-like protein